MRSGPSEQFSPTESGFTCCTAFQNASTVCAEIIVSPPRPTAAENDDRQHHLVLLEDFLNGDQRGLGIQRIEDRLDEQQVRTARDERAHLADVGRLHLIEGDHAKARVVRVRRVGERDGERPDRSGDETLLPILLGDAIRPLAALPRGLSR